MAEQKNYSELTVTQIDFTENDTSVSINSEPINPELISSQALIHNSIKEDALVSHDIDKTMSLIHI